MSGLNGSLETAGRSVASLPLRGSVAPSLALVPGSVSLGLTSVMGVG